MANLQETQIDPIDDDRLRQASELMLRARRELMPLKELPDGLRPRTLTEAYHLQSILAVALSPTGGWKVGAPSSDVEPLCAPLPLLGGFGSDNDTLDRRYSRLRGIEAEIAFHLGKDLPPRTTPYSREEVADAIASAHPAIEILESAFYDPDKVDRFSLIGDLQMNGGFIHGRAVPCWRDIDLTQESVTLIVDGAVRVEATASNTAGTDLLRLVTWLANEGQPRTGGLKRGEWITTGSWTGKVLANEGSEVIARFSHFGEVRMYFAHVPEES